MHRIDTATATTNSQFTEGDPTTGEKATEVSADWLNTIQEELSTLVEYNGGALDKSDNGQLLAQILALLAPALPRTGQIVLDSNPEERDGWVFFDDGTIGPAFSGATTFAGSGCRALFEMYWNNYPNSLIPVSGGGRGSSADADWNAGKTLKLPRVVGRALAVAGDGVGLSNRPLGSTDGAERVQLSVAQLPSFSVHVDVPKIAGGEQIEHDSTTESDTSVLRSQTQRVYSNTIGGGQSHENMPPTAYVMARVKL